MPLSKEKKLAYFDKLKRLLETYSKVFIVQVDNVGSQQMQQTRFQMRGSAEVLLGKNTLIRKVINDFLEKNPNHPIRNLLPKVAGNVGFVFTNSELSLVRDMILSNRVPAPARAGAIAPIDVVIPAGPTGCDPGQTSFFQVLQIPTKIAKGQIEITNPVNLFKTGDKVGASESALLQKLNIKPFSYGLKIECVYDNGSIFSEKILDIKEEEIVAKFVTALSSIAALSLQIGYPTQASIPHSIGQAFKTCMAVALGLNTFTCKEGEEFKGFLANPGASASASSSVGAAAGSGTASAKVEAPAAPVEEEVDALDGGMDMFGGGDY